MKLKTLTFLFFLSLPIFSHAQDDQKENGYDIENANNFSEELNFLEEKSKEVTLFLEKTENENVDLGEFKKKNLDMTDEVHLNHSSIEKDVTEAQLATQNTLRPRRIRGR